MRYDVSCERFCTEGQLSSDLQVDPIVLAGQRKAEISEEIAKLRADRWGYCCLDSQANIVVTNKIAFDINYEKELAAMQELARLIDMFNKLNPLFEEIQNKFTMIKSPSLTGIQQLRHSSVMKITTLISRTKQELAYRSGIQSKGKALDEILKDPIFIQIKETNEKYIEIENAKIKEYDFYIARIMAILEGKDGE